MVHYKYILLLLLLKRSSATAEIARVGGRYAVQGHSGSLLGVTIAADLGLNKHASNVCKTCFFWLRQLRRVRRSLDIESSKTLVHAFVTSRVDYCNSVLSSAPKQIIDKFAAC